jgi:homoserine acetyltransferase
MSGAELPEEKAERTSREYVCQHACSERERGKHLTRNQGFVSRIRETYFEVRDYSEKGVFEADEYLDVSGRTYVGRVDANHLTVYATTAYSYQWTQTEVDHRIPIARPVRCDWLDP